MTLFRGKYRSETARLKGFDYTAAGSYFVTINTKGMVAWFGEITDGEMMLSRIGEIVAYEWLATRRIRPSVRLDAWQIMPNHMHGIIMLHDSETEALSGRIQFADIQSYLVGTTDPVVVGTTRQVVPTEEQQTSNKKLTLKANSLGSIIGQFKSVCSKRIHEMGNTDFQWQGRFYDRIIRNEEELDRIREYIINNPVQWNPDRK